MTRRLPILRLGSSLLATRVAIVRGEMPSLRAASTRLTAITTCGSVLFISDKVLLSHA